MCRCLINYYYQQYQIWPPFPIAKNTNSELILRSRAPPKAPAALVGANASPNLPPRRFCWGQQATSISAIWFLLFVCFNFIELDRQPHVVSDHRIIRTPCMAFNLTTYARMSILRNPYGSWRARLFAFQHCILAFRFRIVNDKMNGSKEISSVLYLHWNFRHVCQRIFSLSCAPWALTGRSSFKPLQSSYWPLARIWSWLH